MIKWTRRTLVAAVVAESLATAVIGWAAIPQRVERPPRPCGTQSDILVRSDPTLAPVRPADCSTVTQTPPEFTWPPQDGPNTYVVTLVHPDGEREYKATNENWLVWDRALPPGRYRWQVEVKGGEKGEPRQFRIAADAVTFLVPGDDAALARAKKLPHPRTWASDETSPIEALKAERARGFASLLDEVEGKMQIEVQPEPKAESLNENYEDVVAEQKRTLAAALAWAVTKQRRYGEDAARRLVAQARWNTDGSLSYRTNDISSRTIAWTLALGYDWTRDYLDAEQRAVILAAIRARMRDMVRQIVSGNEISRYPYDSHGNMTLTISAAISALMAGDISEADDWFRKTVRPAVVWTSPWGGADGGFANGTMQGQWDTGANLVAWYVLRNAAGVDIARKDWVRNHARYLAYFVPPGAPAGLFGDGQEQRAEEMRSRVGKALAAFAPTPIGTWYAQHLSGEDSSRIELLLAPRAQAGKVSLPAGTPNDAVFPSIGWAAMHSDLADPKRASVYFKSSPYGSYNHSHADQNSFVIDYKGERLAIQSGYYDDYGTPHWHEWYKQTRAANAITFDGGQGQGTDGKQYSGEITRFESDDKHAVAVGHAEKAYGGALTKAERTIEFERPNVVIVHDVLASDTPRTWEWNLHALDKMKPVSDRKVSVVKGEAAMCVEMLKSPDVAFSQTDRFTVPPGRSSMSRREPNQWHGVFATKEKSQAAEFVTRLTLGSSCS